MKSFLALACFAASALAQRISIGAPAAMTTIARGSNITIEIDKPVRFSKSTTLLPSHPAAVRR